MRQNILKLWHFVKGAFARDVATVGGGAGLGQLIVLASSPLLTRLYTPEEFGVLAVFSAIVGTLFSVLAGRYEVAIPLPDSDSFAASVAIVGFVIVILVSCFVAATLLLFSSSLVTFTNTPVLEPFLWLVPVALLGSGTFQVLNYWVVRRRAYRVIARTKITQNVARAASQLGLGVIGVGSFGLLLGNVLGRVGGMGSLAFYTFRNDWTVVRTVTIRSMRAAAKRFKRFPLLSAPSALLNKASLKLPELLFASFYSASVAGWLSLSLRIISVPTWLVSQAIHQVYLGEAARLAREEPRELRSLFLKVSIVLLALGTLPAVGLWTLGDPVFPFIFGDNWTEAGKYAESLALMFLSQLVVSPVSMTLNVVERQGLQLMWDSLRFVVVLAILMSSTMLDMSANQTILIYSIGLFITYTVLWFLSFYSICNLGTVDTN